MDFSKNGIGTLGMTQLCEALKNNDMLRTFIMGTNSIGDEGAALLAGYMASECSCLVPFAYVFVCTTKRKRGCRCTTADTGALPSCPATCRR